MNTNEILAFLLPSNDLIQQVFGSAILLLGTITLVMMFWGARKAIWEQKWNGSGADGLDVEHGSVNEISSAVASAGEKMADIMPGVLLILGLLGTFLGLGIALDKASSILSGATNTGGDMDNAMAELMGMMEGLGTKFKTSTWGLIAFLVIKGFASLSKYDERRLRWCINKMKAAFEQGRQTARELHERDQQALLTALSRIDQTLLDQFQANHNILELQAKLSQRGAQSTTTELAATRQAIEGMQQALLPQLQTLNTNSLDTNRSLDEATALLQQHSEQNQQQLEDSHAVHTSLVNFIEANRSNLSAISDAANQMAGAAGGIGQSADQLNMAIGEFKSSVSEVLDGLKRDLACTIDNMGESFTYNMSNISTMMAEATSGIGGAVSDLSENVGRTMTSVQESNATSTRIQKDAHAAFITSSDMLNGKVDSMTTLVENLREQIVTSLRAVSDSNRNMASLAKRNESIIEQSSRSADAINQLVEQLKGIQLSSPLQPAVELIIKQTATLCSSLDNIDKHMLALKLGLDSNDNSEYIHNAMGSVIEHLEGIDHHLKQFTLEREDS